MTYAEMKEIFDHIRSDFRYDDEFNGCLGHSHRELSVGAFPRLQPALLESVRAGR